MLPQQQAQVARLLELCSAPPGQLTQRDVLYIRDRLHETSSFFRLWPPQLQQLLCRLCAPATWARQEVVASQGCRPRSLCFILQGECAVAVRQSPGSSELVDVALLQAGDTFGELALLGATRHPAFVVVRSKQLLVLEVDAAELAQAMQDQAAAATSAATPPAAAAAERQGQHRQQAAPSSSSISSAELDALYALIGEPRGQECATLDAEQQGHVSRICARQLQEAAAAAEASSTSTSAVMMRRAPGGGAAATATAGRQQSVAAAAAAAATEPQGAASSTSAAAGAAKPPQLAADDNGEQAQGQQTSHASDDAAGGDDGGRQQQQQQQPGRTKDSGGSSALAYRSRHCKILAAAAARACGGSGAAAAGIRG